MVIIQLFEDGLTQCLLVLSVIILLRSVFLPINAHISGAMTCTTNQRVLRELFMLFNGRIATSELSLDVTIVNGVFILRSVLSRIRLQ